MSYQFIHTESYSRSAPKTAEHKNKKSGKGSDKKNASVRGIVAEANREAGAHPHVDNPLPPIHLYGDPLEALETTCEAWAASVTDAAGRKLRKDGLCLLAGVVSAHKDTPPEEWEKLKNDSINFLKEKYGDCLKTVIEHVDEENPHIHFYVVPKLGQRFETVHEGRAASAAVKAEGGLKSLQNQAYKAAMTDYQNEYYEKVGIENGLTRIGPGLTRSTRKEWVNQKVQAKALTLARERAKEVDFESAKIISSAEQKAGQIIVESSAIKAAAINEAAKTIEESTLIKSTAINEAVKTIEESTLIKSTAISEAANILQKAEVNSKDLTRETLAKIGEIKEKAEEKGFDAGLNKVEKMTWFKRLSTVLARVVLERDSLKDEVKTLKAEKSENAEKTDNLLKRAKNYFKTAKKLEAKIEKIEPVAKSAERYRRENNELKRENNELGQQLGTARARVQHLEAAYLPTETAETANSNKIARKHENTHSNSAKRSSSSSNSGGSGGDAQLAESRARAARYENEFGGLGI